MAISLAAFSVTQVCTCGEWMVDCEMVATILTLELAKTLKKTNE